LGSSAAVSIALIKVMFMLADRVLDQSVLLELSYDLEKYHHGTPSGIDNTVIALEKPVFFQKGKKIKTLNPPEFYFVIGDSGIGKKTAQVVTEVADNYNMNKSYYHQIFQAIGDISRQGRRALQNGDKKKIGQLMNHNQFFLDELNVSCKELDCLIEIARKNGALGAKLCGAGKGGCMVALAANIQMATSIKEAILETGAVNSFITALYNGR
jgi:mevalonate kinase